ncbi:MAG: hypothetical protein RL095_2264 [Verrucomicrobiota bacterium]|jgi:hypothetical protein
MRAALASLATLALASCAQLPPGPAQNRGADLTEALHLSAGFPTIGLLVDLGPLTFGLGGEGGLCGGSKYALGLGGAVERLPYSYALGLGSHSEQSARPRNTRYGYHESPAWGRFAISGGLFFGVGFCFDLCESYDALAGLWGGDPLGDDAHPEEKTPIPVEKAAAPKD